ncbi:MAG: pantetheine-phosphate adenylyltransferase [Bacteroidota bacterium]|jgi:pantetheine-phosphate adenylyltransferase
MRTAIYPGTFDPITNGHVDVIERATHLFDKIFVAVAINANKTTIFTEQERMDMAVESLKHLPNVVVDLHQGLIVEYAKRKEAVALIRGIRAVSDFEYEFQIALMNRKLVPEVDTIFLMPNEKYTYLNSSIVRELSRLKQNIDDFVPEYVARKLRNKFNY